MQGTFGCGQPRKRIAFAIPAAQTDTSYGRGFWSLTHSYHAAGGRPTRTDEAALAGKLLCRTAGNRGINPLAYDALQSLFRWIWGRVYPLDEPCPIFIWRGRRDLNPRAGFIQPTPLAGEPLRPLGYFRRSMVFYEKMAERVGFEPTETCASPVFKTGSFNRSDISPFQKRTPASQTLV